MDVDIDNFNEVVASTLLAIEECQFLAIDLEMTGLHPVKHKFPTFLDTPEEHYKSMKAGVEMFDIMQVGISSFKQQTGLLSDDPSVDTRSFETKSFNFYVFPRSIFFEDIREARTVSMSSSAITFHIKHDFDFQRWITKGIGFVNTQTHDLLMKEFENRKSALEKHFLPDEVDQNSVLAEDRETIARCVKSVQMFIDICSESKCLYSDSELDELYSHSQNMPPRVDTSTSLESNNENPNEIQENEGTKKKICKGLGDLQDSPCYSSPVVSLLVGKALHLELASNFDAEGNVVITKVPVGRWKVKLLVTYTKDAEACKASMLEMKKSSLTKNLDRCVGFTKIWNMIKSIEKPIIFHNGVFDVMFLMHNFECPLPTEYEDFKILASSTLKNVFDSKLIAAESKFFLEDGISLGNISTSIENSLLEKQFVKFSSAEGFELYDSERLYHQAAFDALQTGKAFCYCYYHPELPPEIIERFQNTLYLMRSFYNINLKSKGSTEDAKLTPPNFGVMCTGDINNVTDHEIFGALNKCFSREERTEKFLRYMILWVDNRTVCIGGLKGIEYQDELIAALKASPVLQKAEFTPLNEYLNALKFAKVKS